MQKEWLFNLVSSLKIKEIEVYSNCGKFGDGGMKYNVLLIENKANENYVYLCVPL